MLFRVIGNFKEIEPCPYTDVASRFKKNEKDLENKLRTMIGHVIFREYLIFGNERSLQSEADLFGVDRDGNLVIFELKVHGHYDNSKIYQAMRYAQEFSDWTYNDMNDHFSKCFPRNGKLLDLFHEHFGVRPSESGFNRNQRIIVISNGSDMSVVAATKYWAHIGIDITEYFYRIYDFGEETVIEISSDTQDSQPSGHCWINTCKRYYEKAYLSMIRNERATAYGDRVSLINERMDRGYVFLYHNGYGIIAAGIGTRKIDTDIQGEFDPKEPEKHIYLKDFVSGVDVGKEKIVKYISPSRIKELLGQNFFFPNSIVYLTHEKAKKLYERATQVLVCNTD